MEKQIDKFKEQFSWEPELVEEDRLSQKTTVMVLGMGGSHLGAGLLLRSYPAIFHYIHSDYGLPAVPSEIIEKSHIIICSYSGETAEMLDSLKECLSLGLCPSILTSGGKLLELARKHHLPHVVLPRDTIEPRMAVPYMMLALGKLLGNLSVIVAVREAGSTLNISEIKERGTFFANSLKNKIPVIYSSFQNAPIAYYLKATFNETAKIPCFTNIVPELCHNELSGFDVSDVSLPLIKNLMPIFLEDDNDTPSIQKRMNLLTELLQEHNVSGIQFPLTEKTPLSKIFTSVLVGTSAAVSLAKYYGVEDSKTPLIAKFKDRMKDHDSTS